MLTTADRRQIVFVLLIVVVVSFLFHNSVSFYSDYGTDVLHQPDYRHFMSPIRNRSSLEKLYMSPTNISYGKQFIWSWFSLREFWRRDIPPIVEFKCNDDKIFFRNAYLDVTKIQGSPVVIFAGGFTETKLWEDLRANRDPSQIWVFNTDESALTTMEYIPPLEYAEELRFNVTFTFHTKAELSVPYGYYRLYPGDDAQQVQEEIDYHGTKPRFAAWSSSHCASIEWSRSKFALELSHHIPLDRYGGCGNLKTGCPRNSPNCTELLKQYKFILGLENSCCEEYITEKFWHPLAVLESIPVVLGGNKADYERIGPPNSFIHIGDFNSMEDLAIYLRRVSNDPALYNSFFQWKQKGFVLETGSEKRIRFQKSVCRLHEYLQSRAWVNVTEPFDVYGPHWLGSCKGCSDKSWITKNYGKPPKGAFTHNR